jgi:hypothetical protein
MNKELNPAVLIGSIAVVVLVLGVIAFKVFGGGGGSSNAAHPGDGQALPGHFAQGGPPSQAPGGGGQ